jgi:UDP-glucose 4-epimerase
MKILVTGGAGFIGSTIVDAYVERGHRVWVLDDESSGKRRQVNKQAVYLRKDINDKKAVASLFQRAKFDVVNHHAAQIDVRRSVADPEFDARVNVLGLLNVLVNAHKTRVKKILFSSSGGTVYGECTQPATESFPEVPLSPYGVAKLASEKYIQAFSALHGLKYTIFRYSNVYGPRQDPHGEAGVVAIFAQRLLAGQPVTIFGKGSQTRDFVYVGDVARANVLGLHKATNEILNIGTSKEVSVNALYATMAGLTGASARARRKPARNGELARSVLSYAKAERVLGWKPLFSLRDGLAETIRFFQS